MGSYVAENRPFERVQRYSQAFQKENRIVPEIEILSLMIEPTSNVVQDRMSQEPQL